MVERVLVVMRLNDMVKVHPQQVESQCSSCGQTVALYPSGQAAREKYPDIKIVCAPCAAQQRKRGDEAEPAGSWDDVLQEMRDSVRRQ